MKHVSCAICGKKVWPLPLWLTRRFPWHHYHVVRIPGGLVK